MESNKILRTEESSIFYVIVADRDGVRKYVSKAFPNLFPYTVKLTQAKRFYSEVKAQQFIDDFAVGNYIIVNPEISKVCNQLKLV